MTEEVTQSSSYRKKTFEEPNATLPVHRGEGGGVIAVGVEASEAEEKKIMGDVVIDALPDAEVETVAYVVTTVAQVVTVNIPGDKDEDKDCRCKG